MFPSSHSLASALLASSTTSRHNPTTHPMGLRDDMALSAWEALKEVRKE